MNKDFVVAMLKTDVCRVVFTKADKSERVMNCTLRNEYIGIESAGKGVEKPDLVVCWDVDKQEWRSFRLDRMISGPQLLSKEEKAGYVTYSSHS